VLTQDALERLQQPTVGAGQRASALRFADPRVMASVRGSRASPICPAAFTTAISDDRKRCSGARTRRPGDLRSAAAGLKGLIHCIPKTHRYAAASYGLKVAFVYAKLYLRILRPEWRPCCRSTARCRRPLRAVLDQLGAQIRQIHKEAALIARKTCFNRYDVILRKCLAAATRASRVLLYFGDVRPLL
jgi:hypothetical protein